MYLQIRIVLSKQVSSRPNTDAEGWTELVLGQETAWEYRGAVASIFGTRIFSWC